MRITVWTKRELRQRLTALLLADMLLTAGCMQALQAMGRQAAPPPEEAVPAMAYMPMETVPADPSPEAEAPTPSPDQPAAVILSGEDRTLRVEVVREEKPALPGRILIYHTHTWEAFAQVKDKPYRETEKWRTKDNSANMVAVGDALTAALSAMGFEVVHDTTAFEPPDLGTSYQRSLTMLQQRAEQGEQYDLYIDLHRDAYSSSSAVKRTINAGGEELARLMVLVGKGEGYSPKPNWQANLEIAQCLTDCLNQQAEGLCREVKVKTGRFNQHIAPHCVLIECGCNYNTLEEVLRSMPYLAEAIRQTLAQPSAGETQENQRAN